MQEADAISQLEAGTVSLSDEDSLMVEMVNNARAAVGAPELKVSPALCEAARIRAKEALYAEAHRRPNGDDCTTVLKDVNLYYPSLETGMTNVVYYNENQTVRPRPATFSAEEAFNNFFNSSGHKRAMLDASYQYIGIGYYNDGSRSAWVQSFARV